MRRHNILDGGAVFRLLQHEGVDQNALIGNRCCEPFKLSQLAADARHFLEYCRGFERRGREAGERFECRFSC